MKIFPKVNEEPLLNLTQPSNELLFDLMLMSLSILREKYTKPVAEIIRP